MARITVEDCLKEIGNENRFSLVHLAVQRVKQHRQGQPFLIKGKNKEIVMTLREIATGDVTAENIATLQASPEAEAEKAPEAQEESVQQG